MRRWTTIGLVVGLVLLVAAGVIRLAVPAVAITLPGNLDQSIAATGTFVQYADQTTKGALRPPQQHAATVKARLHVAGSTGGNALLREDTVVDIATRPQVSLHQQYVVDRKTLKSVPSDKSFAYTPGAVVNRSPAYTDNMPFRSGATSYSIWQNETGTSAVAKQDGPLVHRNGLTLLPVRSVVTRQPASAAFVDSLEPQGIPKTLDVTQLAARLPDYGIDARSVVSNVFARLAPTDRATVLAAVAKPVTIRYLVDIDNRLLIEPRTGGLADVERMVRTVYATPELEPYAPMLAILNAQRYRSVPAIHAFAVKIYGLLHAPPVVPVFSLSFSQTPASAAKVATFIRSKSNLIDFGVRTLPMSLAIAGVLALLLGGGAAVTGVTPPSGGARREPEPVGAGPGPPSRPSARPVPVPGAAGAPKHRAAQHRRPRQPTPGTSRPQRALRRATEAVGRSGT